MSESVYNLIPQAQAAAVKPQRYKSKHNATAPPSCSTFGFQGTSKVVANVAGEKEESNIQGHPSKKAGGTFGRTVGQSVNPKQFLKKTGRQDPNAVTGYSPAAFRYGDEGVRKPGVPKRDEKPVMGLTTDKNFVVANAVENILAVPKKQQQKEVRHVDKNNFGKVPAYIQKTKAELQEHYKMVDMYGAAAARAEAEKMIEMPQDELRELKDGLQRRWESLNKQFQTMGFNLETKTQIKHRESLEQELRHVEQAIAKVSKGHLFVYDDTK